MKKNHIIAASIFSLVCIIVLVGIIVSIQKNTAEKKSLSEVQEVLSTDPLITEKKEIYLTSEKQKQLDQIGEIYSIYEEAHNSTLSTILKKYKRSYSEDDVITLKEITDEDISEDILQAAIKERLGLSILKNDIITLIESKQKLLREKDLELERLTLFQERNNNDIEGNSRELILLTIEESLSQQVENDSINNTKISEKVSEEIFEKNNILDTEKYTNFEQQETLIRNILSISFDQYTSLSNSEKQGLSDQIIKNISELGILHSSDIKDISKESSFFQNILPISDFLQKWGFHLFHDSYAAESETLTQKQRDIAILKAQIQIDFLLRESINAEILFNKGDILLPEYNSRINSNLVKIEELLILKDSLENDTNVLTLSEIQSLGLGSYIDDSVEIQGMSPISYIHEKIGHVIVYNLNNSPKIGNENMLLYPGYTIETLDSTATIVFSDDSILRLEAYSKVTITEPEDGDINVDVKTGNIWVRVLQPLLSGNVFTIETNTISLGIRGTSLSLSKDSNTTVHVIDSYIPDNSPTVTLTEKNTGATRLIAKEKKLIIDSSSYVSETSETRNVAIANNPEIGTYIAEDLKYLSLILDDRERGFYNTPLASKNDGDNFIKKILGELETSLPKASESGIIKNSELLTQIVNTGSIYHILQKDTLITDLKNSSSGNKIQKIAAIRNLDMQSIEDIYGNKRKLDDRFTFEIGKDIISTNFSTPSQLNDIFINFDIIQAQNDKKIIEEVKRNLSPNSGNNIVTGNFSLPTLISGVDISWKSSNTLVLSNTGVVSMPDVTTDVILTAQLTKGNLSSSKDFGLIISKRQLTEEEKQVQAQKKLQTYLRTISPFEEQIDLGATIYSDLKDILGSDTNVIWNQSAYIKNTHGEINQPSFTQGDKIDVPVQGKFIYNGIESTAYSFILPKIKAKEPSVQELLTNVADGFWSDFIASNTGGAGTTGIDTQNIRQVGSSYLIQNDLSFPSIQDTINIQYSVTQNQGYYRIIRNGASYNGTKVPHCQFDKTVSIEATFSITGITSITRSKEFVVPKDGEMIGGECYRLVASAEYNTAGDLNLYKTSDNSIVPNTGSGNITNGCSTNDFGGNCAWKDSKDAINSEYGYDISKVANDFNGRKSWMTYDGESGIVLDNVYTTNSSGVRVGDDFLSYDLSSLDLGTDWAIEMSVRGEDLKRNNGKSYTLIHSTGIFYLSIIRLSNETEYMLRIVKNISSGNYQTINIGTINNNGYNKIQILNENNKGYVYINGSKSTSSYIDLGSNTIVNNTYIGSNNASQQQWNGIINNLKIYK